MLTDSERFAFVPRRLHGFKTTGNAYDACQCDETITKGDTLIVLPEGVVGIAWTWPIAVTAANGALHRVKDEPKASLTELAATFDMRVEDLAEATGLARALGFALDPVFECPTAPG
ncbi:hypothetical protein AQZ52_17915 [Novosphingobium fuchskuhlense]|uniref:Uncharacterized protein n=1 Tax=Novosphingobium fuchskuhlense TaxID=1117702 RepID=A0A124JT71_9SPHN|nr:hypothetical protein [Novosphingobium fuchskuhlense]KUR69877.1 hypothetical protein AQZ52_17915 [Novosphingobium fuchskuhlense]